MHFPTFRSLFQGKAPARWDRYLFKCAHISLVARDAQDLMSTA